METRLTLRPGQPGTRRRLKTVKLVVESVPWTARPCRARRHDDDIVYVRIGYEETDLRARAKNLGALWRKPQKLWEITYRDSKRLGIVDRSWRWTGGEISGGRYLPADGVIHM